MFIVEHSQKFKLISPKTTQFVYVCNFVANYVMRNDILFTDIAQEQTSTIPYTNNQPVPTAGVRFAQVMIIFLTIQ